ncbi:BEN domain-containing protein 3 isoform X2 [Corythoichthys intestinalis]|uniref:BEN domain-containing protein 3 isoform X2 n=1 Tax=Corythoichthys intestinalis TaxID=161448 RepID=UPI0025A64CD8|nr:BEN domain-containing protein 3 isoform X2 [Corythoichthys intestinalis]XP_057715457.1 BEN domain-containing protein 3 isoform X2 [Corythoichthys intestinalis]XP_061798153.1 BEN domain-containing protein 3-like [Nerophis lumbriciformis]
MNSSEHGDASDGKMLEKEHKHGKKDKPEDLAFCEGPREHGGSPGYTEAGKRSSSEMEPDSKQSSSGKRVKVTGEMRRQSADEGRRHEPLCLSTSGELRDNLHGKSRFSYRKPLFSISHRILEKKNTHSLEQQGPGQGPGNPFNTSGFSSTLPGLSQENDSCEAFPSVDNSSQEWSKDSKDIYPLIEKMFFILNSLSSTMTQLHSKVDLLSLEVMRIKKQIKPAQMVTEFQPPPEYLLTSEELNPLMEQTSSAGELGCRLLVHLFPQLFKARECSHDCLAGKRSLESLHLQLIRNYVEACYPSVKNNSVWKGECLPQINDFFNRFWAQRDMESARLLRKQTSTGDELKAENSLTYHFINEQGREELLSQDNQQCGLVGMFNDQATEELDELSSPEDFVIFLIHRLFPELFEEGNKVPEGSNCLNSVGQLILDSDRMEIIKRYMETNFPDVPEESWLQVCVQHMEDALDGPHSNGNASEPENMNDENDELANMAEDVSALKVPEICDNERPSRKSKKSLLSPIDFDNLEIPKPDFTVPHEFLLSKEQLKYNYECSLSIGNFASRLLVLTFPELFTHENARKLYNCSGSLGKKQLDPLRVNLIRHYVQLVYPRAKNDRVWMLEFVGKLDERCRRRDTEQRKSYLQHRKAYGHDAEQDFFLKQIHPDFMREDSDNPTLPPEKSSKDFCKIPMDELIVSKPDFPVPPAYLLSDMEVREIVQQSLSVGNFAARLLVRLFPELFTQDNLRLQYNHSGACNKKQLDPVRLRLIRHYVETVYPVEKMEEVWHYECVPSIDERCRRPNRKKCDILKKAKRSNSVL